MRLSQHTGLTLREAPKTAHMASHCLLARSGALRETAPGCFAVMPLLSRVFSRLEELILEQWQGLAAEPVGLPVLVPDSQAAAVPAFRQGAAFRNERGEVMQAPGSSLGSLLVLLGTDVHSYRQLPRALCSRRPVLRSEATSRFGMLRAAEDVVAELLYAAAGEAGAAAAGGTLGTATAVCPPDSAEVPQQPQDKRQQDAEQKAGGQRDIDPEIAALHSNVAGEVAKPQAPDQRPGYAQQDQDHACGNQAS